MTNFEKELQEMTIEQLADYKMQTTDCDKCPIKEFCKKCNHEVRVRSYNECYVVWLTWLDCTANDETPKIFKYRCPYTDKPCFDWNCFQCEVEKAEREYMESEVD